MAITLLLLVSTWKLGDMLLSPCHGAGLEHTVWGQKIAFYVFKIILVFRNTMFWENHNCQKWGVMHPKFQASFELVAPFAPVPARREDGPRE